MNDIFKYAMQNVSDTDMVGMIIQNEVNQNDKKVGISFRSKDLLSGEEL